MKYAYWTVVCKTPECGTRHFAKLIKDSIEGLSKHLLEDNLPTEFHYQCGKCGKAHSYTPADMVPWEIDPPPLVGLREWW